MSYKLHVDVPGAAKGTVTHDSVVNPGTEDTFPAAFFVPSLGTFENGVVYDIMDEEVVKYETETGTDFEAAISSIVGFTLQKDGAPVVPVVKDPVVPDSNQPELPLDGGEEQ